MGVEPTRRFSKGPQPIPITIGLIWKGLRHLCSRDGRLFGVGLAFYRAHQWLIRAM